MEMSKTRALPLCLPNNCKWDEKSGVYSRDEDQDRTSLQVIDAALQKLRQIKGNHLDNLTYASRPSVLLKKTFSALFSHLLIPFLLTDYFTVNFKRKFEIQS